MSRENISIMRQKTHNDDEYEEEEYYDDDEIIEYDEQDLDFGNDLADTNTFTKQHSGLQKKPTMRLVKKGSKANSKKDMLHVNEDLGHQKLKDSDSKWRSEDLGFRTLLTTKLDNYKGLSIDSEENGQGFKKKSSKNIVNRYSSEENANFKRSGSLKDNGNQNVGDRLNNIKEQEEDNFPESYIFEKPIKTSNLVTMKQISACQYCQSDFNKTTNVPYLFKCNHFFCKACVETKLTDKKTRKVYCPEDDEVADSIKELKVLKSLVKDSKDGFKDVKAGMCKFHTSQALSHVIEDTNETICIYCAFTIYQENPKKKVKELKVIANELLAKSEKEQVEKQEQLQILKSLLEEQECLYKNEEEQALVLFDTLVKKIEQKKQNVLESLKSKLSSNKDKISTNINLTVQRLEFQQSFQKELKAIIDGNNSNVDQTFSEYREYTKRKAENDSKIIDLDKLSIYKGDFNKFESFIENFSGVKLTTSSTSLISNKTKEESNRQFEEERRTHHTIIDNYRHHDRYSAGLYTSSASENYSPTKALLGFSKRRNQYCDKSSEISSRAKPFQESSYTSRYSNTNTFQKTNYSRNSFGETAASNPFPTNDYYLKTDSGIDGRIGVNRSKPHYTLSDVRSSLVTANIEDHVFLRRNKLNKF